MSLEEMGEAKFQEICQLLAVDLGLSGERLTNEGQMAIKRWEEAAEMQDIPPAPSSPLQKLLKEHYELSEQILDAEDAEIDGLDRNATVTTLKTVGR
jgi:hypothetical protein